MSEAVPQPNGNVKATGRGLFWAGIGLSLLAIAAMFAQYQFKMLIVPWYVPILTTLGALVLLRSVILRRSIARIIVFGLVGILAGLQWLFLTSLSKLPEYTGPARVGAKIPAFQSTFASGESFTQKDLEDGTPTVMTFFRGKW